MRKNTLRVFDDVTQAVGMTPLIRIDRFMKSHGVKCQIYVKYEAMNPGQSVKDRIGVNMLDHAELTGKVKPGYTLVECTSGNTGIGIAMAAAVKGYKLIITVPDKVSSEKIDALKALGAQVIVCKTDLPASDPNSFKGMAKMIGSKPEHYWFNQHNNEANPDAHYKTTALEFYEQMEGKIDIAFFGAGTGGTITGNTRKLKELIPGLKVIGIDPIGSVLAQPDSMNDIIKVWKAEGMGQNCVTGVIRRDLVDSWVKADDDESFKLARDLMVKEGMMVGGSCGTILAGIIKYLKENNLHEREDLRCISLMPDTAKNYMTKYMSNDWMVGHGYWTYERFIDPNSIFGMKSIKDFKKFKAIPYYDKRLTIADCFDIFREGFQAIPIKDNGKIIGVVDKRTFIYKITRQGLDKHSSANNCIENDFLTIDLNAPLCVVQRMLENKPYLLMAERPYENDIGDVFVVSHGDLVDLLDEEYTEVF